MSAPYTLPDGLRVYAIGDVHGYLEPLKAMHEAISMDLINNPPAGKVHIVYIGDYVDRGPDSRGVIEYLIERRERGDGIEKTFLMGNHEWSMIEFYSRPDEAARGNWLDWGGIDTLRSYGITFEADVVLPGEAERAAARLREILPEEHCGFLEGLDLSVDIGDYFFTHAGVDPFKGFSAQKARDLFTSREPFLSWHRNPAYKPLEKRVVHGHTISKEPEELPHRVGIDTGLYDGGKLTCAVVEGAQVRFLGVD